MDKVVVEVPFCASFGASTSAPMAEYDEWPMIVVPEYRGFRVQIDAVAVDGRWNAEVRLRRLFTENKPPSERATCYKPTTPSEPRSSGRAGG